jgi:uncharacterized protein DUF4345
MTPGQHPDGGRRALQITLGTLACIPFASGLAGMLVGPRSLPGDRSRVEPSLDNEYRYAHAIWFAAAPVIWSALPQVERQAPVLRAVCSAVTLGGLARVLSWRTSGRPHPVLVGATALELGIPALLLWQRRVAERAGQHPLAAPAAGR